MLQVCPAELPPFDVSVVSEFEEHLGEVLNKPKASMSDFEEMQKKLEAVVTLTPSYAPIKSLESQFTEKFGPEFFRTLDPSDKSSEPVKAVKEGKKLDTLAKKQHEIDSSALPLPPLSQGSSKTDDTPKSKEVLNIVKPEAIKEPPEQSETIEDLEKKVVELKKSFDTEVATEIKFEDILDFDINEHKSYVESISKSIEDLEAMSRTELQVFAQEQHQLAEIATEETRYAEHYGHKANRSLAKLLLQPKPASIKQSSFNAWKAAGFTGGNEFIDLVRECNDIGSDEVLAHYSGHLTDNSKDWHESKGAFLLRGPFNSAEQIKHSASCRLIPFIYRGITHLPPEQSAKFEAAMRAGSVEDMRALARELVKNNYPERSMKLLCNSVFFTEHLVDDKASRLAMAFKEEVNLSNVKEDIKRSIKDVKANLEIEPNFGAALENREASTFVAQFKECVAKGIQGRVDCGNLVEQYATLYYHQSNLELLSGMEVKSKEILESVLDPTIRLFNAQFYLEREDTPDFLAALKANGLASYEDAVSESGKLKLRQDDFELYKKLCLIEKYREYVQHGDLAYIKSDFAELEKGRLKGKHSPAFWAVDKIAIELGMPLNEQQCSFDMRTKKLHCHTPELKEALVNIYKNKEAAELLTQLIRNTVSMNSLPNALHIYTAISKAYRAIDRADYNLFAEINHTCFI